MRYNEIIQKAEIKEDATVGGTTASSIAVVPSVLGDTTSPASENKKSKKKPLILRR